MSKKHQNLQTYNFHTFRIPKIRFVFKQNGFFILFFLLKQKIPIVTGDSTRHSLYLLWRNPPQQDAATTGAGKLRFRFHKLVAETNSVRLIRKAKLTTVTEN